MPLICQTSALTARPQRIPDLSQITFPSNSSLYLVQNRLPVKKAAIKRVEALAEKYIILDSLLFKLTIPWKRNCIVGNT